MTGRVALVGAGPGDPGLLTRRAVSLLRKADLVLYDALVPAAIVNIARRATRIHVGKRHGRHAISQEAINRLLVRAATRGQRVVRLKGGDPFVFGRGGEEALALRAAGIPVDVVPGVSSALAAPALAGIPVTHRGVSTGVVDRLGPRRGRLRAGHRQPRAAGGNARRADGADDARPDCRPADRARLAAIDAGRDRVGRRAARRVRLDGTARRPGRRAGGRRAPGDDRDWRGRCVVGAHRRRRGHRCSSGPRDFAALTRVGRCQPWTTPRRWAGPAFRLQSSRISTSSPTRSRSSSAARSARTSGASSGSCAARTASDSPSDAQMMRIKIPQGVLTGRQLLALADVSEQYARGFAHVTTRQNIQLHFVKLHDAEPVMQRLAKRGSPRAKRAATPCGTSRRARGPASRRRRSSTSRRTPRR